ncbi:MAG: type II secretion system F family protein [Acidimicrobiia bacterium]|nr:type II secretion system F family protein [Acidimicrobiia bacterium]
MRLLAALLAGVSMYLAVGYVTGFAPDLRWRIAKEDPGVSNRQLWLVQAGAHLSHGQFLLWSILLGIVAFIVGMALTGVAWVSLPPALAVAVLPRWYFGRRRIRRLSEVHEAWPDGLRHIVASLRTGMSLNAALDDLARTGPVPLRLAFARFSALSRTLGVDTALEVIREELADPTSDRVVEILLVAYERGGSIVPDVLAALSDATTRDLRTVAEIRTNALEQRINGRIVFVVPWLVLLMLTSRPGPFRDFYASAAGVIVIVIGALVSLFGAWLVARFSRDTIEPRVLGSSATEAIPRARVPS